MSTQVATMGLTQQEKVVIDSPARRSWRRFRRHKLAMIGAVVLSLFILIAIFAPCLEPYDPNKMDLRASKQPPSAEHLLGTDPKGRDVLSRLISASRVSMSVGVVAVSIYITTGTVLGALAGYYGGALDMVISRFTDAVLCFPPLIMVIVIVSVTGPSIFNVMMAIGLLRWPQIMRIVRGEFLSLRERTFVEAAHCLGTPPRMIIWRHILPNTIAPLTVAATFGLAQAILLEAGLSYLGLGVQPPAASWGNMLLAAQSLTILQDMPWLWMPPGMAILIVVLAINFVGDGLRDALDPRLVK